MWSRVVEAMLGCWLLISPFIFDHPAEEVGWWVTDMAVGLAAAVLGIASYWQPTRQAHLLTLVAAAWLLAFAYWQSGGNAAPAQQNEAVLGVLLLMLPLIPNHAAHPPRSWEEQRQKLIC